MDVYGRVDLLQQLFGIFCEGGQCLGLSGWLTSYVDVHDSVCAFHARLTMHEMLQRQSGMHDQYLRL